MTELEEIIERRAYALFIASKVLLTFRRLPSALFSREALIALWHSHRDSVRERYRILARAELLVRPDR